MADGPPFYAPAHKQHGGIPRPRKPGEEVWRVRDADGHVHSCELGDHSNSGAGWDVHILIDGEPMFSRRCVDERDVRFVAESLRQDWMCCGFMDASGSATVKARR